MRRVGLLVLLIASSLGAQQIVSPAQFPPTAEWPKPVAEHFGVAGEILNDALKTRAVPLKNFTMQDVNVGWDLQFMRLDEDTFFVAYTPPARFTFYIQVVICKDHRILDSTILGPTETAAEFYDANLNFLGSWDDAITCAGDALLIGAVSDRTTDRPGVNYMTGEDRDIRHMCYWARYFLFKNKDPKRAADFLVTAIDKHKEHLLALESAKEYSAIDRNLTLFDKQFPKDGFDLNPPLEAQDRARVRSYIETAIRICGKLKPFIPDAEARIKKDEALLAKFR